MARFSPVLGTATTIALLALAACGESSPSQSTLEKQIGLHFGIGDCSFLSISKFKKLNGFPQADGTYIADITYTFNYAAAGKVKELSEEAQSRLKLLKDKYQSIDARRPNFIQCRGYAQPFDERDPGSNPNASAFDAKINDELAAIKQLKSQLPPEPPAWNRPLTPPPLSPHDAELVERVKQHEAVIAQLRQQQADDRADYLPKAKQEWKEASEKLTAERAACEVAEAHKRSEAKELDAERDQVRRDIENVHEIYDPKIKEEFDKKCKPTVFSLAEIRAPGELAREYGLIYSNHIEIEHHDKVNLVKSDNGWVLAR